MSDLQFKIPSADDLWRRTGAGHHRINKREVAAALRDLHTRIAELEAEVALAKSDYQQRARRRRRGSGRTSSGVGEGGSGGGEVEVAERRRDSPVSPVACVSGPGPRADNRRRTGRPHHSLEGAHKMSWYAITRVVIRGIWSIMFQTTALVMLVVTSFNWDYGRATFWLVVWIAAEGSWRQVEKAMERNP